MTEADFHSITRSGALCDAEGGLGVREFELVMRDQESFVECVERSEMQRDGWREGAKMERGGRSPLRIWDLNVRVCVRAVCMCQFQGCAYVI